MDFDVVQLFYSQSFFYLSNILEQNNFLSEENLLASRFDFIVSLKYVAAIQITIQPWL